MDNVALKQILKREMADYAGEGLNADMRLAISEDGLTYVVIAVSEQHPDRAFIALLAVLTDSQIVIYRDRTDRPLYEELMAAGIPREQIICLYSGESLDPSTTLHPPLSA